MIFGRQNNLTRRAVRPDGQFTRQIRRRNAGKATLLELTAGGGPPPRTSLPGRLVNAILRLFGR
jgi:hypothetical protein